MKFQALVLVSCVLFYLTVQAAEAPITQSDEMNYWSPPNFVLRNTNAIGYDSGSFETPAALEKDVQFWIDIYSKYTTQQGVFHLSGHTDQVLGQIDLRDIYSNQKWSAIRRELEAGIIVRRQKRFIAKKWGIKNLASIRLQMGLKDRMQEAIKLSGLYLPMIERIFTDQNLPLELSRVAFVESSFNIHAGSKVGASGLWQIMPRVARQFKYINPTYDKRNHPYYSTLVAARILKQNYQILKSWPLAITAYNHGVGSLKKIVTKYKSNDIGFLVDNVKAKKSFGFASRNFYATFLAALHVEKNANLYFAEPIEKLPELMLRDFYLKKKIRFETLVKLFDGDRSKIKLYNAHISAKYMKKGRWIPEKTLISLPSDGKPRLAEMVQAK